MVLVRNLKKNFNYARMQLNRRNSILSFMISFLVHSFENFKSLENFVGFVFLCCHKKYLNTFSVERTRSCETGACFYLPLNFDCST